MQARILTTKDLSQAEQLWDYSFEKKDTPFFNWYFKEYIVPENIIGCFSKNKLLTMLCINPYTIQLNNVAVPTRYIVGVTTAPEARGLGSFSQLLDYTFRHLIAADIFFVLLKPIAAKLYTGYGFAFCYNHLKYDLELEQLQFFKKDKDISLVMATDTASCDICDLQNIYLRTLESLNGYVLRNKKNFTNILDAHFSEGGKLLLAYKSDVLVGYLLYFLSSEAFTITELITVDNSCQSTFLNFVFQHRTQVKNCNWRTSINNLAYLNLDLKQEPNYKFPQLAPFMMARIINVQKALEKLNFDFPNDSELTILIQDDYILENNGVFLIRNFNNKLEIIKLSSKKAQFEITISAFTQLYFGAYSVAELISQKLICSNSLESQELLQKLFPIKRNYINEEF